MKTILKITTAFTLLLVTTMGYANESKIEFFIKNNSKDLIFKYDTKYLETTVEFVDQDNNVFYSEDVLHKAVYAKKFNVENLKDGCYFLNIENTLKTVSYAIHIKGNTVIIDEKKEVNKPIFQKKDNDTVIMSFLNKEMGKVYLSIYNENGDKVYKEEIANKLVVEKAFNFSKLVGNNFRFVVNTDNDSYSNMVSIQ